MSQQSSVGTPGGAAVGSVGSSGGATSGGVGTIKGAAAGRVLTFGSHGVAPLAAGVAPVAAGPVIVAAAVGGAQAEWEKKGLPSHTRDKDNRPVIHGTTGQRPNFRLGFAHACDRRDPDKTILKLKLNVVCFCVDGCKNTDTERGHFVRRLVVSASPAAKWREKVTNVSFSPPVKRTTIAKVETKSVTVSASANPTLGGVATNCTKYEIDNHVWSPATLDDKTESVTWEWQLNSWGNGESLNPHYLWGIRGKLPKLPFDNTKLVTIFNETNVESLQGDWEVSNDDLEGIETIDWDITVNVCTLSFSVKYFRDRAIGSSFQFWDTEGRPFQAVISFKLT